MNNETDITLEDGSTITINELKERNETNYRQIIGVILKEPANISKKKDSRDVIAREIIVLD